MTKQEFWDSFEQHIPALEKLLDGGHDYSAYNALSAKLREFNELLIPEITMKKGVHVLIISCDGIREGISAVEYLTQGVEGYTNWQIVKYRQPNSMDFIPVHGFKVKRNDIWLSWEKTPENKYDLTFFPKWYSGNRIYQTGALLHLDHAIGEYNAMIKVNGIEFKRLGLFQSKDGLKNLDEFKAEIVATS